MEMNSDIFTPDLPIPELVEFEDTRTFGFSVNVGF